MLLSLSSTGISSHAEYWSASKELQKSSFRKKFKGTPTNKKLDGISVLNAEQTILKKINPWFIISFFLDK